MELPDGDEEKIQPKGDEGMGIYDSVSTLVCKQGERTFVGSWMFKKPLDWDLVHEAWASYVFYCNRHNIMIGRHDEVSR